MGGGQSRNTTRLQNEFNSMTSMVTNTFLEVTHNCIVNMSITQQNEFTNTGNINIGNISQDVKVKSYSNCKSNSDATKEIESKFKLDLQQKVDEKKDAFFSVFEKAVEALGDTAAIALGGNLVKEHLMENSTNLSNAIVDNFDSNFVTNAITNISTKQANIFTNTGDVTLSSLAQTVNYDSVQESVMGTSLMQSLKQVVDAAVSQDASKKSSFGLFDALGNFWTAIALVIGIFVLMIGIKMMGGGNSSNKNK